MSKYGIWTTNDGRDLEVNWMDSVHIVHSVNLLLRRHATQKERVLMTNIAQEAQRRKLLINPVLKMHEGVYVNQYPVPLTRETRWELAIMNARRELPSGTKKDQILVEATRLMLLG